MTATEVMDAVRRHHDSVCEKAKERNVSVIMTVLDGSQNYGLDHDGSDIDTFSFILPSVRDMSQLKEPITTEYWVEDGKCSVKDIRLALNLLIKTSPNSLEWFTSKFQIKEPDYENVLAYYLAEPILNQMIHSNYFHMLKACEGMSHQLSKRNMTVGKRYSHCLRMIDMWETYLKEDKHPLSFRSEENRLIALNAKLSQNEDMQEKCEEVADHFHRIAKEFSITEEQKQKEQQGQKLVRQFEYDLMMRHLYMETNAENTAIGIEELRIPFDRLIHPDMEALKKRDEFISAMENDVKIKKMDSDGIIAEMVVKNDLMSPINQKRE